MAAVVRDGQVQNVNFCPNVHISELTYIWKLLGYTSGTCLKNKQLVPRYVHTHLLFR